MGTFRAEELAAGMAAGLVQDAVLHPADTLRARLDVASSWQQHGPVRALLHEVCSVVAADGKVGRHCDSEAILLFTYFVRGLDLFAVESEWTQHGLVSFVVPLHCEPVRYLQEATRGTLYSSEALDRHR